MVHWSPGRRLGLSCLPQISLDFNDWINLAWGSPLPNGFDFWKHDQLFLIGAFIFEDVAVTAYQVISNTLGPEPCGTVFLGLHCCKAQQELFLWHGHLCSRRISLRVRCVF